MQTVDDALGEKNNFDALRLFAAVGVIYSHAYAAIEGSHKSELLYQLSGGTTDLGEICVFVFFLISGFLIAQSFARSTSMIEYFTNRTLRIVPGLVVITLLTAFVMGPLLTTEERSEYWSSYETYRYLGNMLIYPVVHLLPGVFDNYPFETPNASVWTLCYEFSCYLFVAGVGLLVRRSWLLAVAVLAFSAATVFYTYISPNIFIEYGKFFLAGSVIYLFRRSVVLDFRLFLFSAAVVVFAFAYNMALSLALVVFGSYSIIYIAYAKWIPLHNIARHGDVSYGVYLYGWPVQQMMLPYSGASAVLNFLLTLPPVFVLAALSWKLVEKPSLRRKKRIAAELERQLARTRQLSRILRRRSQPG